MSLIGSARAVMFDWPVFLADHNVPFVSKGANIGHNEIGICCPYCGHADSGQHLAISLLGRGWICRRNRDHRGKAPARLVAALLGCSLEEAHRLTGSKAGPIVPTDATFGSSIASMFAPKPAETQAPPLSFPPEIKPAWTAIMFLGYLMTRGYSAGEAEAVARQYELRGAMDGPFRYRLVIPVEMPDGLATWTGRALVDGMVPRYKALSTDPAKCKAEKLKPARLPVSQCLWNAKELADATGELLLVCEGPLDALRIDYYGREVGIRATCLFGKNMSHEQAELIPQLGNFKRRALLLDNDAVLDTFRLAWKAASSTPLEWLRIPAGIKDPAMLSKHQVQALLSR
jgi:hypothetical protein